MSNLALLNSQFWKTQNLEKIKRKVSSLGFTKCNSFLTFTRKDLVTYLSIDIFIPIRCLDWRGFYIQFHGLFKLQRIQWLNGLFRLQNHTFNAPHHNAHNWGIVQRWSKGGWKSVLLFEVDQDTSLSRLVIAILELSKQIWRSKEDNLRASELTVTLISST